MMDKLGYLTKRHAELHKKLMFVLDKAEKGQPVTVSLSDIARQLDTIAAAAISEVSKHNAQTR